MVRCTTVATAGALVVGVLLTGCSDPPAGSATPPPADLSGCLQADEATLAWHGEGSLRAATGLVEGGGDAVVVVSYESPGDVCSWTGIAGDLADQGISVLLYERLEGLDPSEYLPGLVATMRSEGYQRVGLLGGSLGGIGSIESATVIEPPVDAVVSLSGADGRTVAAAAQLTSPLLQVVAEGDGGFVSAARATDRSATASPDHRLVVVPGSAHASLILSTEATSERLVTDFLQDALGGHRARGR